MWRPVDIQEIKAEVDEIFRAAWTTRDGYVVPTPGSIKLETNDAVKFAAATVLYADLAGSTHMVDTKSADFAAEVYRAFLAATARVIRNEGGVITAYDGDRVMAVFLGDDQCPAAVRCGLKINWVVKNVINVSISTIRPATSAGYQVMHRVGIDTTPMFVARTGVRGGNDLVWVGKAANYAAKLAAVSETGYETFITDRVFGKLNADTWYTGPPSQIMWMKGPTPGFPEPFVYKSSAWWLPV
jgi:class 3 adenylate cyclase